MPKSSRFEPNELEIRYLRAKGRTIPQILEKLKEVGFEDSNKEGLYSFIRRKKFKKNDSEFVTEFEKGLQSPEQLVSNIWANQKPSQPEAQITPSPTAQTALQNIEKKQLSEQERQTKKAEIKKLMEKEKEKRLAKIRGEEKNSQTK